MAYHYMVRNKNYKARIRSLKAKLKRASRRWKEKDRLQIFVEASLAQHNTWWRTLNPNFKKFGTLFAFLKFLGQNTGFSAQRAAPPGTRFLWRSPNEENSAFMDFSWRNMHAYQCPRKFDKFWAPKRVKNTPKMTFLPLFGHTGSSVGKTPFWRGKWRPNLKIPLVLESTQVDLSKTCTWRRFGHREGLQKWLQIGTMHREISATHWRNFAQFHHEYFVFRLNFK